ncbi:hypothetical protein L0337_05730 [candidate division KSB1 bacterium]|nr:hypothetical protein [candidate division KSB1 bacterium]
MMKSERIHFISREQYAAEAHFFPKKQAHQIEIKVKPGWANSIPFEFTPNMVLVPKLLD